MFLEHLSAWGEAWIAQDFEHVAISLLFIGGGLVSLLSDTSSKFVSDDLVVRSDGRDQYVSSDLQRQRNG